MKNFIIYILHTYKKEVKSIKKGIILLVFLCMLMIPCVCAENVTIDNTMSIQDAVNNVNDNDTIYLTPGTYTESGIKIDKNITLQGMGTADEVIIDGNNSNTIILVNSVSQIKFFNLTFINGNSPDYGGAIHSELGGQIYVDSCNFINNTAKINGGAIDIAGEQHNIKWQVFTNYGFLNATDCKFINNKAYHDGGALAIYWGNSYVYNSYFSQNYADRDGGSIRVGVYSTTFTENCTFDNNTAKEWGGALYNWPGELTVNNCTITNNNAGKQGGAMITSGPLTVTNSKIINNTAVKKGGVVYIAEETPHIPSTVIFKNNYIEGNYAKQGSLVFADETTSTATTFDGNYWDIDPTSDEWAKNFITNDLINMPTKFIDENGNIITLIPKEKVTPTDITPHVPEERADHHDIPEIINQTNDTTSEKTENTTIPENTEKTENATIPENTEKTDIVKQKTEISNIVKNTEILEELVKNVDTQFNSTTIQDSNIGENPSQSSESIPDSSQSSAADDASTAHKIVKKDVAKKSTDAPLPYIIAIIVILAILGYGFLKSNKNDD